MTTTHKNYINGEWVDSHTGQVFPSTNPANTSEVLGYFQKSDGLDARSAIEAAAQAFPDWAKKSAPVRGEFLFTLIRLLEEQREELAAIITSEVGKTLREARGEVLKTIASMKQLTGEATRLTGQTVPSFDERVLGYTVREPIGVFAIIAPWNFPLGIGLWKIVPAILAGNTVVFKPASNTSLISVKLTELLIESGVPKGVVNLVTGPGSVIGDELSNHPLIKGISFTGSSEVGLALGKAVGARGGKIQAEMGGKNPAIILADADIDLAIDCIVTSGFFDNGQRCTGTSRVLVVPEVAEEVKRKLVERARSLKVGNGFDPESHNGPVVDEHQLNLYLHYVQKGIEEGGVLECGGQRLTDGDLANGYFVAPTVFTGITQEMTIAKEEIFAPVIAVIDVDSFDHAMEIANQVEFGLSSTIFTNDLQKAFQFVKGIQSGVTHVNMPSTHFESQFPFGGKKISGLGPREQGESALDFYVETKTVYIRP
ncbi:MULTISPECIES: aldehyde dehydrogenase family protein [Brevibacillus]|jgi:acyl-CoA reductase-like NAD-dependent aldehyde dehydrogenase|uniref:Putative aldehyde dehydrogenase YcbD n=1 Tax=Brevibacillus parabrevis TaxID=54914 RepID=A0A4Y3PDA0_BREPA|nr:MULTISPECIES: aldehyde dehydrogenase family protein [Brevibacillus]MED2257200.1 aldehyde dehydrogenase family protein [Brevibacillus parabrevis]RNB96001.1 aldehyde dehydrogenase family protein [Brevibacillus parabrevis]UED71745.1 aldehyde dehydrogenase family protein [Brevibacillus sp. HD3.3A]WDV97979.1 aldehyde dehydrogenase family protein [Brevibacillus parabrevis]GEB32402.1 putative aldehyde dehydrogenase YcbD [Brevibacillus parabrevis]